MLYGVSDGHCYPMIGPHVHMGPPPPLLSTPQVGNRFALTAAHCLYDDDNKEVLPATSFSIMLGLHDRRKTKERNR